MSVDVDPRYVMQTRADVPVLTWPLFDGHPVAIAVTTREGGISAGPYASLNLGLHVGDDPHAVRHNRARAAATIGLDLSDLVFCTQAHGRRVVRVTRSMAGMGTTSMVGAVPDADALVTTDDGVGLVVMMADCVPIVLFDPVMRALACVHAGWRGTVAGVVDATIATMVEGGTRPQDLLVGVGPAVAPSAYQVGDDVHTAVHEALGASADDVITADGRGRWLLDLWAANVRILCNAGVAADRIALAAVPTGGAFYSDRAVRPCGRFGLLARLT